MESGLQFRYQASWSAILEVVRVMFEVLDSVLFFLFANVNIVYKVSLLLVLILQLKSNIYSTTRTFSFLPFNVQVTTTKPTNCSFSFELVIRYLKAVADLREGPVGPGPPPSLILVKKKKKRKRKKKRRTKGSRQGKRYFQPPLPPPNLSSRSGYVTGRHMVTLVCSTVDGRREILFKKKNDFLKRVVGFQVLGKHCPKLLKKVRV